MLDYPKIFECFSDCFLFFWRVYDQQKENGKQVFMAYDTLDSYNPSTRQLIEKNAILELSPGGNELFGWAWNKEKQDDETKQK